MKEIEIKKTTLTPSDLKGRIPKDPTDIEVDYTGIIEHALDTPPQGGFTPKDIRERNRIQVVLDKCKDGKIELEDADFSNLKEIIKNSRWGTRDKELQIFLEIFEKDK